MSSTIKHDTSSVFIFFKEENQFSLLLVHHKKFDKWMIPGGHVESYENQFECALREVKEETGLDIEIQDIVSEKFSQTFTDAKSYKAPFVILEEFIPEYKDKPEHFHLDFLYFGFAKTKKIQIAENESNDIKWFNQEEFNNLNLFESTKYYGNLIFKHLNQDGQT